MRKIESVLLPTHPIHFFFKYQLLLCFFFKLVKCQNITNTCFFLVFCIHKII